MRTSRLVAAHSHIPTRGNPGQVQPPITVVPVDIAIFWPRALAGAQTLPAIVLSVPAAMRGAHTAALLSPLLVKVEILSTGMGE